MLIKFLSIKLTPENALIMSELFQFLVTHDFDLTDYIMVIFSDNIKYNYSVFIIHTMALLNKPIIEIQPYIKLIEKTESKYMRINTSDLKLIYKIYGKSTLMSIINILI